MVVVWSHIYVKTPTILNDYGGAQEYMEFAINVNFDDAITRYRLRIRSFDNVEIRAMVEKGKSSKV